MTAEELHNLFQDCGADALFLETDFLRRYLTGFYSTDGYVVLDERGLVFFADPRYFEAAERKLRGKVTVLEGSYPQAMEYIADRKTVALPYPYISASAFMAMSMSHQIVDCMPFLQQAMICKSEEELALIRRACELAEDALLLLLPDIREGMTENEVAALLEYRMRQLGASGVSFETIVAFGAHSSVPHHETGETRLTFGDIVLIDFGCKVEGYCSDCTRTFLFGDDGKHARFKQIYEDVLTAHELVKEGLVSGMTGREGDAIARSYLESKGLGKYFTHSLGHGIGLQIHEAPVLSPRSSTVLTDGMVFSDEPGVYLAGELGVRIEDSCYMEQGRTKSFMHKTSKNLIIL